MNSNEGGVTITQGGAAYLILPAGCRGFHLYTILMLLDLHFCFRRGNVLHNFVFVLALHETDLGSSFWGMVLILSSTDLVAARIAAACLGVALIVVLFVAKNVRFSMCFNFHALFCECLEIPS